MKIHFVVHESFEAPAAIKQWAIHREHELSFSRLFHGDVLPSNADHFDFLVVMGGPQSPSTTVEDCPHFNAKAEMSLIEDAIFQDKVVLGVCLGAQLIGEALGARFEKSPHREIGVFPITLTKDAKKDPLLEILPETLSVAHWHADMPGLTKEATVLATSAGCPRQIIRYNSRTYGFQCHFEFTTEAVTSMIARNHQDFGNIESTPFVTAPETLQEYNFDEMNAYLYKILDRMSGVAVLS